MRNLDLNSYGVQEMSAQEMKQVEGGLLGIILTIIIILLASNSAS